MQGNIFGEMDDTPGENKDQGLSVNANQCMSGQHMNSYESVKKKKKREREKELTKGAILEFQE